MKPEGELKEVLYLLFLFRQNFVEREEAVKAVVNLDEEDYSIVSKVLATTGMDKLHRISERIRNGNG